MICLTKKYVTYVQSHSPTGAIKDNLKQETINKKLTDNLFQDSMYRLVLDLSRIELPLHYVQPWF